MTSNLVSVADARRRARFCLASALLTWATLTMLSVSAMPFLFGGVVILMCLPWLPTGFRVSLYGPGGRFVTARTLSGRRTVDLHRLVKVGRIGAFTQGPNSIDRLLLVDADGVRLLVDDPEVDKAVRRVLPNETVKVSRAAAVRLEQADPDVDLPYRWFFGRLAYTLLPVPLFMAQLYIAQALP